MGTKKGIPNMYYDLLVYKKKDKTLDHKTVKILTIIILNGLFWIKHVGSTRLLAINVLENGFGSLQNYLQQERYYLILWMIKFNHLYTLILKPT